MRLGGIADKKILNSHQTHGGEEEKMQRKKRAATERKCNRSGIETVSDKNCTSTLS